MNRSELMQAFLAEVDEQLQQLEQDILHLEQEGESDRVIQNIFRTAHTLKGSSAAMGFQGMKSLTHEMENVLDKIRNRKLLITPQAVDILFECLDCLGVLKREIETIGTANTDTSDIVLKLRQLADGSLAPKVSQSFICQVVISPVCEMKTARAYIVYNELLEYGKVLSTEPNIHDIVDENNIECITYVIESDLNAELLESKIRGLLDIEQVTCYPANSKPQNVLAPVSLELMSMLSETSELQAISSKKEEEGYRKSGQTIRVDVERLETLMNLVGELVIDQTRISQVSGVLRDKYNSEEALDDLEQVSNHITRVISELQESVMKTRMLPIEQLFNRFPRMVRDLSQTLGKDIELLISGKETELDRTVIEEIGDPLIHLIRNSVDHGIESKEVRHQAGKPVKGTVRMSASHQENQVVITVEDDGGGIRADKMRDSAVEKGVISTQMAEGLSDKESVQLIFEPGFSTASEISDVSGRGVGMDIVRSHIEKLNGLIDVDTRPGEGTKFTIKLPLTLAILRGLLIKLNELTYALPMSSVIEIVRIPHNEIHSVKSQAVVKFREKALPILWLHDHFAIPRNKRKSENVFLVVVGAGEKRLGLIVDELIGNQEIVVKSIGSYIGKVEGVSGATILGDGSVALILDITGILKLASVQESALHEREEVLIAKVV
ncbi:chemotaxis protein CheA [Paenibacillus agricola]|uniref:Chemotaxis protein CheA n=1 Tax=Paenibacillus agricola TaxID=2716264 RepID=A0ABX0JAN1_9BACL|nr:chemotaxis protein CheA [Paenibacillus agricola]NHN32811.1 chemotaxis protein CheA [Paenibacillus agricola]